MLKIERGAQSKSKKMDDDAVLLLISYVQRNNCLWDENHADFKRVSITRKIWKEIGSHLNITGDEAKFKWQKIKGRFKSLVRKSLDENEVSESSSSASKWKYYNYLLFLKDGVQMEAAKSTTPLRQSRETTVIKTEPLDENDKDFEDFNFDNLVPTFSDKETNDKRPKPGPRSSKKIIKNVTEKDVKNEEPGDKNVSFSLASLHQEEKESDDDRYFMLSLMPYIAALDPVAKLELRAEIQSLVTSSFKKQDAKKRSRME